MNEMLIAMINLFDSGIRIYQSVRPCHKNQIWILLMDSLDKRQRIIVTNKRVNLQQYNEDKYLLVVKHYKD